MEDIYIGGQRPDSGNGYGGYNPGEVQPAGEESDENDIYISPQNRRRRYVAEPVSSYLPQEPYEPEEPKKKKKKKRGFFRFLRVLLVVVLLLCGTVVGFLYHTFSSVSYNETGHKENVFVEEDELLQSEKVKNILLIGVDRRNEDEASRSDTMLMLSVNTETKKILLTSFMRDTYVYIPEKQKNAKLNAACTWGGAQMVMDTIEYNFNVRIDHYMLVDFTMFESIIDGLGGVEVEVTGKEAEYLRDKVHLENIEEGTNELDGKEALWYCRIRALDSDFNRTERQRKVMTAIIEKATGTNPIELYKMLGEILPLIETDMTPLNLTGFAVNGLVRYLHYDVEQGRVPADDTWSNKTIGGQAVLSVDMNENQKYLKRFIYQ